MPRTCTSLKIGRIGGCHGFCCGKKWCDLYNLGSNAVKFVTNLCSFMSIFHDFPKYTAGLMKNYGECHNIWYDGGTLMNKIQACEIQGCHTITTHPKLFMNIWKLLNTTAHLYKWKFAHLHICTVCSITYGTGSLTLTSKRCYFIWK